MKFIIDNWSLFLIAIASGGLLLWPLVKGATGGTLTPARAVQLINREKAVLIDVSETEEFALQHAGGARNIPLADLEARLPAVVKNKAVP
ncbi:MAG: rhodanese-like domain-containing protein, partial [Variovorax sp.]